MQGKYPDILKTIKQQIYANFLQPTICYKTAIAIKRELLKSQKGNDDDDWLIPNSRPEKLANCKYRSV